MTRQQAVDAVTDVRCVAVSVSDGVPLVVIARDVAARLGGAVAAAAAITKAWSETKDLPPIGEDLTTPLTINSVATRIASERLPVAGRMVPVMLVVGEGDVGAVPRIVEVVDLRGNGGAA